MIDIPSNSYTSFNSHQRIASGSLQAVALVVKRAIENGATGPILTFDDASGRSIDIDMRGSDEEVVARLEQSAATDNLSASGWSGGSLQTISEPNATTSQVGETPHRGRPKLGVVPREVTLLPRHWEWLATQPGGPSVALRKLVEEARRTHSDKDRNRKTQESAYRFMSAIAGNLPGFEEATRALFANERSRFSELIATWPDDVRDYTLRLVFGDDDPVSPQKS